MSAEWSGDRWQYWAGFMFANVAHALLYDAKWEGAQDRTVVNDSEGEHDGSPDFVPEALIPVLNERGAEGWELVTLRPVTIDPGHEPQKAWFGPAPKGSRWWAHAYICVMKRRVFAEPLA